jgi:hypothetical protein
MKNISTAIQSIKNLNELLPTIARLQSITDWVARLQTASALLKESSYLVDPLIGAPNTAEEFIVHSTQFDCVTYVETVLALANCTSAENFQEHLLKIRYRKQQLSWIERNHYMTQWIKENSSKGYIRAYFATEERLEAKKTLTCLKDYPPSDETLVLEPVNIAMLDKLQKIYQDGDVIFFGSSKVDLDYFHLGLLFSGSQGQLVLRHASRTANKVLDEDLEKFLERVDGCLGVSTVRPIDCR